MLASKEKNKGFFKGLKKYLKNRNFQRIFIGIISIVIAFIVINNGATPERYNLKEGDISKYDISATRDIVDKYRTEILAKQASRAVTSVMTDIQGANEGVRDKTQSFLSIIEEARFALTENGKKLKSINSDSEELASFEEKVRGLGLKLTSEQFKYMLLADKNDIERFKIITELVITKALAQDITSSNLAQKILEAQNDFESKELSQELKNIGGALVKTILVPNKTIDEALTQEKRDEAYNDVIENKSIVIKKGERVINQNERVTKAKYDILKELNLLHDSSFDFALAGGILTVLLLLFFLLILYMNHFCKKILQNRNDLLLLSTIILLTIIISRGVTGLTEGVFVHYSLSAPIFIAAILISVLLDLKLAIIVNFVVTVAVSIMTKGDLDLVYLSLISGTFTAFIVSKANQRNKLFMSGVGIAIFNVLIIVSLGLINGYDRYLILKDSVIVALNGILCMVLALGTMPFWETVFNVITPLKLMELANPNQPLVKRLLMEAPGTYHHSLMVGNLAEVATEAIGGNALLARVGAYFHDIGKLKRPNFFKENQLSDNPHDRMTANLSTLVITSHPRDGIELAKKYKIPVAIRDIIIQHHGTTLVVYFYHKAKKSEKENEIKQENFRYEGPKPSTKEAAVVMLADSVEAAVRSMADKTEGKIEGLVRKIIKDKLDDGQLDLCSLTLKDLDDIAKSFMSVLSGLFHEREEYPDIKGKQPQNAKESLKEGNSSDVKNDENNDEKDENGKSANENSN